MVAGRSACVMNMDMHAGRGALRRQSQDSLLLRLVKAEQIHRQRCSHLSEESVQRLRDRQLEAERCYLGFAFVQCTVPRNVGG